MIASRLSHLPQEYRVVTEAEAAAYCSLSLIHFRRPRREHKGPRHIRLGPRRIGYRVRDLLNWLEEHACKA